MAFRTTNQDAVEISAEAERATKNCLLGAAPRVNAAWVRTCRRKSPLRFWAMKV